jgi:hypothetical protein
MAGKVHITPHNVHHAIHTSPIPKDRQAVSLILAASGIIQSHFAWHTTVHSSLLSSLPPSLLLSIPKLPTPPQQLSPLTTSSSPPSPCTSPTCLSASKLYTLKPPFTGSSYEIANPNRVVSSFARNTCYAPTND